MSKTAMVRARLEPDLKHHAESVFHRLGLNATQAITIFYRQVELRDGLPFDVSFRQQPRNGHSKLPRPDVIWSSAMMQTTCSENSVSDVHAGIYPAVC